MKFWRPPSDVESVNVFIGVDAFGKAGNASESTTSALGESLRYWVRAPGPSIIPPPTPTIR